MLKMIAIGNLTGDPVLKTNEETGKPYASSHKNRTSQQEQER